MQLSNKAQRMPHLYTNLPRHKEYKKNYQHQTKIAPSRQTRGVQGIFFLALLCLFFLEHQSAAPTVENIFVEFVRADDPDPVPTLDPEVLEQPWSGMREDLVIEISDSGPMPKNLEMKIRQGILFFYNATTDSDLSLEIDFGKNAMVCYSSATPNLQFQGEGKLTSTRPIKPGNFASTCFPTFGTYPYRVSGIKGSSPSVTGQITVSPRS